MSAVFVLSVLAFFLRLLLTPSGPAIRFYRVGSGVLLGFSANKIEALGPAGYAAALLLVGALIISGAFADYQAKFAGFTERAAVLPGDRVFDVYALFLWIVLLTFLV